ncbi:MAG TPA: energy transducer TonB [Bacteroidota bacterium]|nr:energy transducer TonB [Bacteroidota bacterium]
MVMERRLLLVIMMLVCGGAKVCSQGKILPAGMITNQDWRVEGDWVIITYDLVGAQNKVYQVYVELLNERNGAFRMIPQTVNGDIGVVQIPGPGKEIRWNYKADVPGGLKGEGYYFIFVDDGPPPDFVPFDEIATPITEVRPSYPPVRRPVEGSVLAKAWVGKDGRVKEVRVIKSDYEPFSEPVMEAAKQWVFSPARFRGEPVSVWVTIPFRFKTK